MRFDKPQPKPTKFANAKFFGIKAEGQYIKGVTIIGPVSEHRWGEGVLKKDGKRDPRFMFPIRTATGEMASFSATMTELHDLQTALGMDSEKWIEHSFDLTGEFYEGLGEHGTWGTKILATSIK